jgi:ribonuclease P/MRP protein subunit POP5
MAKLKPLLPTLKERKRYVAFKVLTDSKIVFEDCKNAIWNTAIQLFGEVGVAQMGLYVLPEKYDGNKGILRVAHTHQNHARMALCFVEKAGNHSCTVRSIVSSGILKKALQVL